MEPDALIIQDPTLLHQVDVFGGCKRDGFILINTAKSFDELGLGEFVEGLPPERLLTRAGRRPRARAHRARRSRTPRCSAGFAALSGLDLARRRRRARSARRFAARVVEGNVAAARDAHAWVTARCGS